MTHRVLLSTTSYQDTPGDHHDLLDSQGYDIVRQRGPLSEERMFELAGQFDGFLCGDDLLSPRVLEKSVPRLKVISKYGIGLDKIDLAVCDRIGIPVLFTPGVNHTTVAEHTFALLLALVRNLVEEVNFVRSGQWKRITGHELWRKEIGVVGVGRIGREVVRRARGFDMKVHACDPYWPEAFCAEHGVQRHESVDSLIGAVDIITLHTNLSETTRHLINTKRINQMRDGALLINTSRGELVDNTAIVAALTSGKLGGYGADVLDEEPPPADHPLLGAENTVITPHIGSRTFESVPRQAMKATRNLVNFLKGEGEITQANEVPLPEGSRLVRS